WGHCCSRRATAERRWGIWKIAMTIPTSATSGPSARRNCRKRSPTVETERTRREPVKTSIRSRGAAGPQLPDSVSELLRLQRAAGNQATVSLLAELQRDPD